MERLKVYCRGGCAGVAVIERRCGRVEICVTMDDPGDGLYRAVLMGERGQLMLGVLEPHKGTLTLRRRPYARDVERVGKPESVQVSCSFVFPKKCVWQRTERSDELVDSVFLKARLAAVEHAWWRREGERLIIYALDGQDMPV